VTRRFMLLGVAVFVASCASPTGGWDLDRLLADHPEIAALAGQRIGDMTPYPAWHLGGLVAVACRFDQREALRVRGDGPGWEPDWARATVAAVDRGVEGIGLELVEGDVLDSDVRLDSIEIESIMDPEATGPAGLADTLALCDVTPTGKGGIRGTIEGATIRIRRTLPLPTGRVHHADRAEWTGALLHEFGHALGFSGHAAIGDSIVHLEQSRLRALGRRASAGEAFAMPTLSALYQIDPGRELIRPSVEPAAEELIRRVVALVDRRTQQLGPPKRVRAIAGDEDARLVWIWSGGVTAAIDFPGWRKAISSGRSVRAEPSRATRRVLGTP